MSPKQDPCDGVLTEFLPDGSVRLTHSQSQTTKFVSSSHLIVPACLQLNQNARKNASI